MTIGASAIGQLALGEPSPIDAEVGGSVALVSVSLSTGSAQAATSVPAEIFSEATTFIDGSIGATVSVAGQILSDSDTLVDGGASVEVVVPGTVFEVGVEFVPGGATTDSVQPDQPAQQFGAGRPPLRKQPHVIIPGTVFEIGFTMISGGIGDENEEFAEFLFMLEAA